MVDLGGGIYGSSGIAFDNLVFVIPGIIVIGLAGKDTFPKKRGIWLRLIFLKSLF